MTCRRTRAFTASRGTFAGTPRLLLAVLEVHKRAVSVSPGHYHHVRLHKGSIPGKLHDGGDIRVERTKYFDFDTGNGTWFGLRLFQD